MRALVLMLGGGVTVLACGADPPAAPPNAGTTDNTPSPAEIRCTDAELAAIDKTDGSSLEVVFNTGANPRQYENRCATIRAGTAVTFRGSFKQHPLEPAGGDSPSPIPRVERDPAEGKITIIFNRPGTYGYQCTFHPMQMFGALKVLP